MYKLNFFWGHKKKKKQPSLSRYGCFLFQNLKQDDELFDGSDAANDVIAYNEDDESIS